MDNSGTTTNKPRAGSGERGNARLPDKIPTLDNPFGGKVNTPGYSHQKKRSSKARAAQKRAIEAELNKIVSQPLARRIAQTHKKGWAGAKGDDSLRNVGQGSTPAGMPLKTYQKPSSLSRAVSKFAGF